VSRMNDQAANADISLRHKMRLFKGNFIYKALSNPNIFLCELDASPVGSAFSADLKLA